jgi:hypothetical protein
MTLRCVATENDQAFQIDEAMSETSFFVREVCRSHGGSGWKASCLWLYESGTVALLADRARSVPRRKGALSVTVPSTVH